MYRYDSKWFGLRAWFYFYNGGSVIPSGVAGAQLHFRLASIRMQTDLMTKTDLLRCDGCGQSATPEHIAERLRRLEWTTRYRPVHIGSLLLRAFAPDGAKFLYAGGGSFEGEAKLALKASGVSLNGKSSEAVLTEFQRRGLLLTYVLECPLNPESDDPAAVAGLLRSRIPAFLARVRRSLRPRRIVPISGFLEPLLESLRETEVGCPVVLDGGKPFALDLGTDDVVARLSEVLADLAGAYR
jgi:hypothetical protein